MANESPALTKNPGGYFHYLGPSRRHSYYESGLGEGVSVMLSTSITARSFLTLNSTILNMSLIWAGTFRRFEFPPDEVMKQPVRLLTSTHAACCESPFSTQFGSIQPGQLGSIAAILGFSELLDDYTDQWRRGKTPLQSIHIQGSISKGLQWAATCYLCCSRFRGRQLHCNIYIGSSATFRAA